MWDPFLVLGLSLAGQKESLLANLQQYKLESRFVDMLVADAATCTWTRQELFDAIVTDRTSVRDQYGPSYLHKFLCANLVLFPVQIHNHAHSSIEPYS